MSSYKPGDPYYGEFTTSNPSTGAAVNADALPTATANRNGADDGAFALTVANLDAGRYKVTGTIPGGYASGDVVNISVAATLAGVAGKAVIDSFVLDSKRVGDLADFAGGEVASVAAPVTVGTNNDKTGYALTSGERTTLAGVVWSTLTSGLATAGSIGKAVVDFVTALGSDNRPILSADDPTSKLAASGTVNDVAPSTTAFKGSSGFSTDDDWYVGRIVIFTASTASPSALNAEGIVTGYDGTTRQFQFGATADYPTAAPLPTAPANGDSFTVV